MSTLIHWHEGLFLQPQHFQAMQRGIYRHLRSGPGLHLPFPCGVVTARFTETTSLKERIEFQELHVVMPGGTVFHFRDYDDLPSSVDISLAYKKYPGGFTVGLAIPTPQDGGANTIPAPGLPDHQKDDGEPSQITSPAGNSSINRRYMAYEIRIADENDPSAGKKADASDDDGEGGARVQVLRHNGRLMLAEDIYAVLPNVEFLPLMRYLPKSAGDPTAIRDARYVPPTLLLCGSQTLFELVNGLADEAQKVSAQIRQLLTAKEQNALSHAERLEEMHRLRCISRSASQLTSFVDVSTKRKGCAGRISVYQVYLAMQEFLSDLSALHPEKAAALHREKAAAFDLDQEVFSWPPYDHYDPYASLAALDEMIRGLLYPEGILYRLSRFVLEKDYFVCQTGGRFFRDIKETYLSVAANEDPSHLISMIEDSGPAGTRTRFTLFPGSYLDKLLRGWGLVLKRVDSVPRELSRVWEPGTFFYKVDTAASDESLWQSIQSEPKAAIRFQHENLAEFRFALYVTLHTPDVPTTSP